MDYSNPKSYDLRVLVLGMRIYEGGTGPCGGTVNLQLVRYDTSNGWMHIVILYDSTEVLFLRQKNLNNIVLEHVRLANYSMP